MERLKAAEPWASEGRDQMNFRSAGDEIADPIPGYGASSINYEKQFHA
jgi:hypothetical protein